MSWGLAEVVKYVFQVNEISLPFLSVYHHVDILDLNELLISFPACARTSTVLA